MFKFSIIIYIQQILQFLIDSYNNKDRNPIILLNYQIQMQLSAKL